MAKQIMSSQELANLLDEAGDTLVIIDFYATWCGPCKTVAPIVDRIAAQYKDELIFLKVDVDEKNTEDLVSDYKIEIMPTFVFKRNGKTIASISGGNEKKLRDLIEKHLK